MRSLTVGEFKAQFSEVLTAVQAGESVVVCYGRRKERVFAHVAADAAAHSHVQLLPVGHRAASAKFPVGTRPLGLRLHSFLERQYTAYQQYIRQSHQSFCIADDYSEYILHKIKHVNHTAITRSARCRHDEMDDVSDARHVLLYVQQLRFRSDVLLLPVVVVHSCSE